MLKLGSKGPKVAEFKNLLIDAGYKLTPGDENFGPMTLKAVIDFQRQHNLTVDGEVGPKTLEALRKFKDPAAEEEKNLTPFRRENLARLAEVEANKGLIWTPGSEATKYTKIFDAVFGKGRYSWCGTFVTWCCRMVGLNIPLKTGSKWGYTFALVEAWQQWAKERGFYHDNDGKFKPEAGDIVIFDWSQPDIDDVDKDWEDHIGVHLRMDGPTYICAEGNTNNRTAVKRRTSKLIQGWVRIPDGYSFSKA